MKKSILFLLILASILSACQSAPQVTVTLTPPPTETPIPTPTLHPQFVEIQEQIAASGGRFSLQADGTILDDAEPIPGLTVTLDGTMTLTVNGETVTLDLADVTFDDNGNLIVDGYEQDENGNWVEAVVPKEMKEIPLCDTMYDVLTPANKLNPEHMVEFKDLSAIANWVQSQLTADMFNPDKILMFRDIGIRVGESTLGDYIFPDPFGAGGAPHFTERDAPLYKNNPWCASTMIDGKPNLVFFVPQYIPGVEPTELPVMVGVHELKEGLSGAWPRVIGTYLDRMNMIPWIVDEQSIVLATKFVNPATGELFTEAEVRKIFGQMEAGDFSNTNGLVMRLLVGRNDGHWFE